MPPLNVLASSIPDPVGKTFTAANARAVADTQVDTSPRYIDRESSLIEFYRRVLEEAQDERNPLLERVKFLAILGTNVDEFVSRRGGTLRGSVASAAYQLTRDGEELLRRRLLPALGAHGIPVPDVERAVLGLRDLWTISALDCPALREQPFCPLVQARLLGRTNLFEVIREGDVLLHHPYESFQPVVDLLQQAACDPAVLSISMTMYRTDRESAVGHALVEAARRGKQVLVVVEPNARRDEQNNANWASALARAGACVIRGVAGLKVHAKLALIDRREGDGLERYVHISTGNYHTGTARTYTDLGLLTCRHDLASDVAGVFGFLAGHSVRHQLRTLAVAPFTMRQRLRELIEREIAWTRAGERGHVILKMNALVDHQMIQLLERASQAGVHVDLIVRGICCLRPGVRNLTDRIHVRSIVGRLLEHSRAWYFRNGGCEEAFLASADLMPRNLDRRVEVAVPLSDGTLVSRIRHEILATSLADNVKARELAPDGSYARVAQRPGEPRVSSQLVLGASRPEVLS